MLNQQVELLKEELRERSLLIKILNFRNANDGSLVDADLIGKSQFTSAERTPTTIKNIINNNVQIPNIPKIVDYDETSIEYSNITDESEKDQHVQLLNSTTIYNAYSITDEKDITSTISFDESQQKNSSYSLPDLLTSINERYSWQKHSSGAASRIMHKMGYKGRGLGKKENGRRETIPLEPKRFRKNEKKETETKTNRKLLYILSDSMLNQMDQAKLSKQLDVRIGCHGECTVKCLYTHLTPVFTAKPEYIMLHIGTNDCTNKTSDVVLNETTKLAHHIEIALPNSKIILSLPTMRTDNNKPNVIIRNLKKKAYNLPYTLMENENINEIHIGHKGLHRNGHGIKKMAKNIISLAKHL